MKTITAIALSAILLTSSLTAATWDIDQAHSEVGFQVKHMVIAKVNGKFDSFSGTIDFDGKNFQNASVAVTIDVKSIDTDNEKRDGHLKSGDFFLADSFPQITFKSTRVIPGENDKFQIVGDLTIRGVTRQVTLDAVLNGVIDDSWGNKRAGFSAATEINRFDYGVSWDNALETGGLVVSKEVRIMLEVEAVQKK